MEHFLTCTLKQSNIGKTRLREESWYEKRNLNKGQNFLTKTNTIAIWFSK